jgi:hypothetical protein
LFDTIARDDEMTEFERQRIEAENTMMAAAKRQLGAPTVEGEFTESDEGDGEETALQRGLRLLDLCQSSEDVQDLQATITDELTNDADRNLWSAACNAHGTAQAA